MKPIEPKAIRKFCGKNEQDLKTALIKAKASISAARLASKTNSMSDAECLAYSQAICAAEEQLENLVYVQKSINRKLVDKHGSYDIENFETEPEYQKITKELKDSKKVGISLFKQALMRNPDDEQLRLLCAGSMDHREFKNISCVVEILEDPEIAKNTALSIRIIDAAIQWRQALDFDSSKKYDDFELAKEFMVKNFSPKVVASCLTNDKEHDASKHPSYERGTHLLGKFEQRIKGSKHRDVADETMGCLSGVDQEILQAAFENSPRFTKAYSNLVQSYKEAYVRAAMENLDYMPSYQTYDEAMTKQNKVMKTASALRLLKPEITK